MVIYRKPLISQFVSIQLPINSQTFHQLFLILLIVKDKITADQLFAFTKDNANVYVNIPGCIKELDELTDKFMSETKNRPEIFKQTEQFIQNIKCEKVNTTKLTPKASC